jgi:5S rRNA maturation endonuclease (ribonuclease M5)
MTTNQTNKYRSNDYGRLNALTQLVCYRLDDLFEKLEVNLRRSGRMYVGCCPVHCGDNYSALNLYPEGESVPGIWRCNTKGCHHIFKNTIVGFTRGILSQKYFDWTIDHPKDKQAPFDKVLNWLCKFIGVKWNDIKVDKQTEEIHQFSAQVQQFHKTISRQSSISREAIRKNLQIPAQYYINRGYAPATLDRFDVGLCTSPAKEMYNRVVVPLYDENGKYMVGCTGRSVFEKCNQCACYHSPTQECPNKGDSKNFTKWRHSGSTGDLLYNWWNTRKYIKTANSIILVEGPGDLWKLHEAGINNAVAMLGANLSDTQEILIERSGAMKINIIRDNDAAGELCEKRLREQLRHYHLRFIVPSKKDVGEMTVEQIKQEILPCLI